MTSVYYKPPVPQPSPIYRQAFPSMLERLPRDLYTLWLECLMVPPLGYRLSSSFIFSSFFFSKIIQIQIHQLFTLLGIPYTNSINLFSHSTSLWLLYYGLVPQVPVHLFSLTECILRTRALLSLPSFYYYLITTKSSNKKSQNSMLSFLLFQTLDVMLYRIQMTMSTNSTRICNVFLTGSQL